MRTNKKASLLTTIYCRVVLRTNTNQKASSSTKLYCGAVPRTRTNYVLRRKTKSECNIKKQKDANNEETYDVPKYFNAFNVFECGGKILDRLDVSYERAFMATPR